MFIISANNRADLIFEAKREIAIVIINEAIAITLINVPAPRMLLSKQKKKSNNGQENNNKITTTYEIIIITP